MSLVFDSERACIGTPAHCPKEAQAGVYNICQNWVH